MSQIDEDFLARYQMSYGTGVDPDSVNPTEYAESYWSNPPEDINSEEYRNWYNQYCSYFFPQHYMSQMRRSAEEDEGRDVEAAAAAALAEEAEAEAAGKAGTVTSSKVEDSSRGVKTDEDGKKKKKRKNTDLLTKHKPVEPPGNFKLLSFSPFDETVASWVLIVVIYGLDWWTKIHLSMLDNSEW